MNKSVQLVDNGDNLFPFAVVNGVDVNNILASDAPVPYTVSEDCYAYLTIYGYEHNFMLDGVTILYGNNAHFEAWIFLKKGQVLTHNGTGAFEHFTIYGIKR